jgi:hypothetical protein
MEGRIDFVFLTPLGNYSNNVRPSLAFPLLLNTIQWPLTIHPSENTWGSGSILQIHGRKISFFNTHLTAYPYPPHQMAIKSNSVEEILEVSKNVQGADIERVWEELIVPLEGKEEVGVATFLVGDHNIPSHIDGAVEGTLPPFLVLLTVVADYLDSRYHLCRSSLLMKAPTTGAAWPVSEFLFQNHFLDSWRVLYPDVIAQGPLSYGFTW